MNVCDILWAAAGAERRRALPVLSFPAAQKLHVTVDQLVKDAELQAQAMALVARETDTLAAVSLMDLSVEAEAFGANVHYSENEVPVVTGQLIEDMDAAQALKIPSLDEGRARTCVEGVRLAKQRIQDKPVLAGIIGPYSLAGRLMDVTEIMYICYDEPEAVHEVLDKVTTYLITYGQAMKDAGADGVMMAEPLAGLLSPDMAEEFSMPYVKRIVDALQSDDFAVIYHNCGNSVMSMLDKIFAQGAAAYHFGNAVSMAEVMAKAPADVLCMGNLDPAGQLAEGTPESVTAATKQLMEECGQYKNFVPSSGCDIPFHAKWENIEAFFAAL
jgi:uroporphyrinogen decarboxylase